MLTIESLFEIGEKIHEGGYEKTNDSKESEGFVIDFKIYRIDDDTIVFERRTPKLNKQSHECGIITKDPKYWNMSMRRRRRKIDDTFYISLMKFSGMA